MAKKARFIYTEIMDTILVIDFGGQTAHLICRRIREAGVYSVIISPNGNLPQEINRDDIKGIVLSGSPFSVYQKDAPTVNPAILNMGVPILGICYGAQWLTNTFGGEVEPLSTKEYGRNSIEISEGKHPLFDGFASSFVSWMSHGDTITVLAPGFRAIASSVNTLVAAIANDEEHLYGVQFHPEATHCEGGTLLLENFSCTICGAKKEWHLDHHMKLLQDKIRGQVANGKVLLLISGGVDSTVAGALLLKALPAENLTFLYVDTGLMRRGESEEVMDNLAALGAQRLIRANAEKRFLTALSGVTDPEEKRRIIGDAFIKTQEKEVGKLFREPYFLAQGTLYTDLIESGFGVGSNAGLIKSHHNVGTPLVKKKREEGLLIEPLSDLYKDEVRKLGELLGLSERITKRHPFPGPGLAIRIPGEVTREKVDILRAVDAVFIEELHKRGLYHQIWQAFSLLLPVKSVGVAGDARKYGWTAVLRSVVSHDGMTADPYPFDSRDILDISSEITNKVPEIGRVVYDLTSKPPATIEWE